MTLLRRIANVAVGAPRANAEAGSAHVGGMLRLGDLVHGTRVTPLAAGPLSSSEAPQDGSEVHEFTTTGANQAGATHARTLAPAGERAVLPVEPSTKSSRSTTNGGPVPARDPESMALEDVPASTAPTSAGTFASAAKEVAPTPAALPADLVASRNSIELPSTHSTLAAIARADSSVAQPVSEMGASVPAAQPRAPTGTPTTVGHPEPSLAAPATARSTRAQSSDQPSATHAPLRQAGSLARADQATAVNRADADALAHSPAATAQRWQQPVPPPVLPQARAAAPSQPPRVHIGNLEVIVEAPPAPQPAHAAGLRGASFASRHYLRGL